MFDKEYKPDELLVLFRVNGGKIGLGHLKRCISLAQEFTKRNIISVFVVNEKSLLEYVKDIKDFKGHVVHRESDFFQLLRLYATKKKIIILDGYFANDKYIRELKNQESELLNIVLLDTLKTGRMGADILVNPAPYSIELYEAHAKVENAFLLGPDYSILDDEYKQEAIVKRKMGNEVLVSMGGSDPLNITKTLAEKVFPDFPEYRFNIILGNYSQTLSLKDTNNVKYYRNINSLKEFIIRADYAISGAGTTLFELIRYRVPSLTISQNESQANSASYWGKMGCLINLGVFNEEELNYYIKWIDDFLNDDLLTNSMKCYMTAVVNPDGKSKVVDFILNKGRL